MRPSARYYGYMESRYEVKRQQALANAKKAAEARDAAIAKLRAIPTRTDTMYVPGPFVPEVR